MLSKLLKYEYRATAIYFIPIYIMLIVVSCFSYVFRVLGDKVPPAVSSGFNTEKLYNTLLSLSASIYVLLAIALAITTMIVIIMRFYKNLLGNEGYLMFTLPVSVETNILAKLIPAMTWFIGSCILGIFTIFPAFFGDEISLSEMFEGFSWKESGLLLLVIIWFIASLAQTFLFYYLCMCIGQLFNSHKFIASAAAYIGIQGVLQVLFIIAIVCFDAIGAPFIDKILPIFANMNGMGAAYLVLGILDSVTLLVCVGLFFLDSNILKKKLNLT